jgi:type II secretion system protein J
MKTVNNNSGFTLIEMLVAVAVSSVILLMVYTAYNSVIKTVNYGRTAASYYKQLNHILNRIDSDLTCMYWKEGNSALQLVSIFNGSNSIISFVTAEYRDYRILPSPVAQYPATDIHETGYYLVQNPGERNYTLIRKTDIHYDDSFSEGGFEEELLTQVVSLKFEFQYRSDWSDNWNTADQKRLPKAVRTTLETIDPFGNVEKYSIISLPGLAYE